MSEPREVRSWTPWFLLAGLLGLVGAGVVTWQNHGPAVRALMADLPAVQDAARAAFATEPATFHGTRVERTEGEWLLYVEWIPKDLAATKVDMNALADRVHTAIEPKIPRGTLAAVIIAARAPPKRMEFSTSDKPEYLTTSRYPLP